MTKKRFLQWVLACIAFFVPLAVWALPNYSGFTTRGTGYVVQAADWNNEFGNLIAYVNSNLTATLNQVIPLGNILCGNGTAPTVLTNAGSADNGKFLQLNNAQPAGLQWVSAVGGVTQLTTKGDLLGYGFNLTRIPVGVDGQSLVADSTNPNGVSYQNVLPSGSIILWSGVVSTIPTGFALCDGVQNVLVGGGVGPNLQGLFVVCAGGTNGAANGGMGGLNVGGPSGDISGGQGLGPTHNHALAHALAGPPGSVQVAQPFSGFVTGSATVTPRYYALAYIQKL